MTYLDGKRCWANQVIFGVTGPQAFNQLAADRRQVLAAGDSNSDATFVGDATVVSLVINRNQDDLMCRAYDGLFTRGGKWAINPMFIDRCPSTLLTYAGRHSSTPTDRNNRYCATTAPQSPIKSTRSSDF